MHTADGLGADCVYNEVRLSAFAVGWADQDPAHVVGGNLTPVHCEQMQRQIGGREHSARGVHWRVVDVEAVDAQSYVREGGTEFGCQKPVGRGTTSVEDAGIAEQERPTTEPHHAHT